ncbi:MAG: hypothetical protein QW734_05420 [Candidatus Bathyarchaeia archaeon]
MIRYPDKKTIKQFIDLIAISDGYYEIRFFSKDIRYRRFFIKNEKISENISRFIYNYKNANNFDWYIGIFARNKKDGTSEAIDKCNLIFIDIDDYKYVKMLPLLIDDVKTNFFNPYIVAVSGRGVHIYFRIDDLDKDTWRIYQKIVGEYFKNKYNAEYFIDVTRIARIIGTWNYKSNKPTFLSYYSKNKISIEELNNFFKLKELSKSV